MIQATLLFVLFFSFMPVVAWDADAEGACEGTVTTVPTPEGTLYVDDRTGVSEDPSDIWVYAESNGIADLQRGGVSFTHLYSDNCLDSPTPDTLIF